MGLFQVRLEEGLHLVPAKGWALLWSPELFQGTDWSDRIRQYRFFSYFYMDSLKMTSAEWGRIMQLLVELISETETLTEVSVNQSFVMSEGR